MIIEGVVVWHTPSLPGGAIVMPPTEALRRLANELSQRALSAPDEAAAMLRAQAMMARDPVLLARVEELCEAGVPADEALLRAADSFGLAHADLRDIAQRAAFYCHGNAAPTLPRPGFPHVLVAQSLSAADMLEVDRSAVTGIVTVQGGPTSHAAILARSFGIPFRIGYPEAAFFQDGQRIRIDAETPAPASPQRVPLLANVSSLAEAIAAAPIADGIGLLRTEFLYPSLDYAPLVTPFGDKPVIIRALDLGDRDRNPLGVRGLRYLRANPSLLDAQLAAIAALPRQVSVMAPMVSTVDDARWFAWRARSFGLTDVGVMIEVPSAALCASEILDAVDFASIGTNDLVQFTLAASREEATLSSYQDASHPAVLRLIEMVITAGKRCGKPVGACGEAVADPAFAELLVSLGISHLSRSI